MSPRPAITVSKRHSVAVGGANAVGSGGIATVKQGKAEQTRGRILERLVHKVEGRACQLIRSAENVRV